MPRKTSITASRLPTRASPGRAPVDPAVALNLFDMHFEDFAARQKDRIHWCLRHSASF